MPVIPDVPVAQPVQRPQMNPAMTQMAPKAMEGLVGEVTDIADKIQDAQEKVQSLKLEHGIKWDSQALIDKYDKWGDFNTIDKSAGDDWHELEQKYHGLIKGSPRLQGVFGAYMDDVKGHYDHLIQMKKTDLIGNEAGIQLGISADETMNALSGMDIPDKSATIDKYVDHYRATGEIAEGTPAPLAEHLAKIQALKGVANPTKVDEHLQGFTKQFEEADLFHGLNSQDPKVVEDTINKLQGGYYKKINRKEIEVTEGRAQEKLGKMREIGDDAEADSLIKELKSKTALNTSKDYDMVLEKLKDPELMDKYGSKVLKKAREWINDERTDVRHKESDYDDSVDKETDTKTYGDFDDRINRGDDPKVLEKEIKASDDMHNKTRTKLLDKLHMVEDKEIAEGFKSGDEVLKDQIAPSKGMLASIDPKAQLRLANAKMDLHAWVKKEQEAGRSPSSIEITQHAMSMLANPSYFASHKQMAEDRKERRERLYGKKDTTQTKKENKTGRDDSEKKPSLLTESDARKQMTAKGVVGDEQDKWINIYRQLGKVK